MKLSGFRIRINPLSPLILCLAIVFSDASSLYSALIALGIHEGAHLISAIFLKARVDEIEIMPFGAAIRLYELWETSPGKLILIALSGPAANILLAAIIALIYHYAPNIPYGFLSIVNASLAIGFINLIPALPLDGGRAACAILAMKMPGSFAVKSGIWAGRVLAAIILILSIITLLDTRRIPLLPVLSSIYIIASGEQEKRQSEGASLRALLINERPFIQPENTEWITVHETASVFEAAKAIHSGRRYLFSIEDTDGNILGVVSLEKLRRAVIQNPEAPVSSLLNKEASSLLPGFLS